MTAVSQYIDFDPTKYGFKPYGNTTACWRGFWCDYAVEDGVLLMKRLYINTEDGVYPDFNGVSPVLPQTPDKDAKGIQITTFSNIMGMAVYEANMPMHYNGRMLLGRKQVFSMNMGYAQPEYFAELLELVFEDGILQEANDQSEIDAQAQDNEDRRWWIRKRAEAEKSFLDHLEQRKKPGQE